MKIKTSKYGEIGMKSIEMLLMSGATVEHHPEFECISVYAGGAVKDGERINVRTSDKIVYNGKKFDLTNAPEDYFTEEIEI